MQKQAIWDSLFLTLGMLLFFPLTLIGLDFTDTGYHFFNQTHLLNNFEVMHMVAYHWLSDFIGASLIQILQIDSILGFRVLGWIVWTLIALFGLRILKKFLYLCQIRNLQIPFLVLSLLIGFCFSINNLSSSLILPDYYSIPLLALVILLDFYLANINENSNRSQTIILLILFVLPFLRWPLILFSFIGVLITIRKHSKIRIAFFISTFLALFGLYKIFFLDSMIERDSVQPSYLLKLLVRSMNELSIPLPYVLALFTINVSCYFLFKWKRTLSYALALGAGLSVIIFYVLTYEWSIQASTFNFQKYLSFILWVSSGLTLAFFTVFEIKFKNKFFWISLFLTLPLIYCFGSDNGIRKSSLLGFLYIGPFFYIVSTKFLNRKYGALLLISFLVFGISFSYRSIYRDDIEAIYNAPTRITDPLVGFAISTKKAASRLNSFREIHNRFSNSILQSRYKEVSFESAKKSLVYSNIPLLGNILESPKEKWIWLDILLKDEKLAASLCRDNNTSTLFIAKYSVSAKSIERIFRAQSPKQLKEQSSHDLILQDDDAFLNLLAKACNWVKKYENEDFVILERESQLGI